MPSLISFMIFYKVSLEEKLKRKYDFYKRNVRES